ncbi:hypothetical protein QQF64_031869 [Cirrhinus molitorella]|uniref:C-type lectin domain-containing protein n=1 Tax=Cirrhinus molitorella TaxID=172907 RepID=A0ABR3MY83_9TELE
MFCSCKRKPRALVWLRGETSPSGVILPFHTVFTFHVVPWKTVLQGVTLISYRLTDIPQGMQSNKLSDDVEGNPDRVDPFYHQGKVACVMFTVLLLFSFLVIGIVTGLNFRKNPQEDQTRGLLSDDITPIPFQNKGLCSDGWVSYKNTCYLIMSVNRTWELSEALCHIHGAHLMVVNNEEELEFISRVVQKRTDYWIGLKRNKMGQWFWVNGDNYNLTPHFWDENQPAYWDMESCVHFKGSDTARQKLMHDADCHSERYHICERKIEKGMWTLTATKEGKLTKTVTLNNMESVSYDRFTTSEAEINHTGQKFLPESGRQNRKMYILYGVLVLYVFILTLAVGIKISQVSKDVADVRLSLETLKAPKTVSFENAHFSERVMPVQGPCEADWLFYKDSCYFQSLTKKNWQTAEKSCVEKKSHLVVVNDLAELDFLSSIVKMSDSYWIGLVEKQEGKWSWVDGTDFSTTEHHWDVGQPDDWDFRVNGEDCGQLHARLTLGRRRLWNDADCTLSYPYICEGKPKSH